MVYGLWFMVYGLWFMVYGLWLRVHGLWLMAYGLWLMVYVSGFSVWGLGFRVWGWVASVEHWTLKGVRVLGASCWRWWASGGGDHRSRNFGGNLRTLNPPKNPTENPSKTLIDYLGHDPGRQSPEISVRNLTESVVYLKAPTLTIRVYMLFETQTRLEIA